MPRFPRQESKPPKGGLRKLGIRRNVGAAWATRSPPSDCPPEGKKIVDQTSTYDTRCLIIPLSERRGWPGAYEETILNLAILPRLNRIVLGNRGRSTPRLPTISP